MKINDLETHYCSDNVRASNTPTKRDTTNPWGSK